MGTSWGVDVSAYQGNQDWASLKKQGLSFALAKATEGQQSHDPSFPAHIAGIKSAGLVPGAYHFAWPNTSIVNNANNYINAVKSFAGAGFTHWLDLEEYSDHRNYVGRSHAQIKAWAAEWVALVKAAFPGQRVGVYTSSSDISSGNVPAGLPLWYPAYPGSGVNTYAEAVKASKPNPSGWVPLIWQFTNGTGSFPAFDQSICYMSDAELHAWAGTGIDVPLTDAEINKIAAATVKLLLGAGGVLENNDIARIWDADQIPAARPPYNNGDYFKADGKTPNNVTWSAKYTQQTQTEGIRQALTLIQKLQTSVDSLKPKP